MAVLKSFRQIAAHILQALLLLDIKQLLTFSYHAACDCAGERALKTFVNILGRYTSTIRKNWDVEVFYATFV